MYVPFSPNSFGNALSIPQALDHPLTDPPQLLPSGQSTPSVSVPNCQVWETEFIGQSIKINLYVAPSEAPCRMVGGTL